MLLEDVSPRLITCFSTTQTRSSGSHIPTSALMVPQLLPLRPGHHPEKRRLNKPGVQGTRLKATHLKAFQGKEPSELHEGSHHPTTDPQVKMSPAPVPTTLRDTWKHCFPRGHRPQGTLSPQQRRLASHPPPDGGRGLRGLGGLGLGREPEGSGEGPGGPGGLRRLFAGRGGEVKRPAGSAGLLSPASCLGHLQDCRGRGRVLLGAPGPHGLQVEADVRAFLSGVSRE